MRQSVRIYRDWRQGSSGSADPAAAEYNSENAQLYENGTLGPRPGWKEITESGTPGMDQAADELVGVQWYPETDGGQNLAVVVYDTTATAHAFDTFDLDSGSWDNNLRALADLADTGAELSPALYDDSPKAPVANDGSIITSIGPYLLFATATTIGTVSAVTTASGDARAAVVNRERAYYYGIASKPGRIFYSNAADFSTIGSTAFFDINADVDSVAGAPIGLWSVKNSLLIACKDNRWLVLTGASPENGTLKELGKDVVPLHATATVVDNTVWFLSPTGHGIVAASPGFVETEQLAHLSPLAYPGSTESRPSNSFMPQSGCGDDVNGSLFLPGRKLSNDTSILAVERTNQVFTLSRWVRQSTTEDVVFSKGRPNELYCAVDNATDFAMYSRNYTLNRPANSGDSLSVALGLEADTASGTDVVVDLGEHAAGQGMVVRPVKVVADIDYWKGGNYSAPEFAVDATVYGTEAATPEDVMAQQTVTTSGWTDTVGDAPYKRRVAVALPNLQFGTRFRIRLTFDNVAIDTIQVYYDEQDDIR